MKTVALDTIETAKDLATSTLGKMAMLALAFGAVPVYILSRIALTI